MIAFIDLETTGLDEKVDPIIEFGCVMVNEQSLETAGELTIVIKPEVMPTVHPRVLDMHMRNGLWDQIPNGESLVVAEQSIVDFLQGYSTGKRKQHILAGSGVSHFDRRFIAQQMPEVNKQLTFWTYDVGVVRRAFESAGRKDLVGKFKASDKSHRALDDARLHADEWRKFQGLIKQIPEVVC